MLLGQSGFEVEASEFTSNLVPKFVRESEITPYLPQTGRAIKFTHVPSHPIGLGCASIGDVQYISSGWKVK